MSKPSKRIPNREAFERMNFLYQVRVVDSMLARTVASQSQQASIQSKFKYDWKKRGEKKKWQRRRALLIQRTGRVGSLFEVDFVAELVWWNPFPLIDDFKRRWLVYIILFKAHMLTSHTGTGGACCGRWRGCELNPVEVLPAFHEDYI